MIEYFVKPMGGISTEISFEALTRYREQAGMQLLAIPFIPTHAEYIYLQGRNVLADQMAFLRAHFPRSSPLRERTHQHPPLSM